jgi:hypothetical protein
MSENEVEVCGHKNVHHANLNGEREPVFCELPKGHNGDHQADYVCWRPTDGSTKQAKMIAQAKLEGRAITIVLNGKEFIETVEKTYWSDGASVPVEDIKPDLEQLAQIKSKKGNMLDEAQILRKQIQNA